MPEILVGDIGGTNCRLALFNPQTLSISNLSVTSTSQSAGPEDTLRRFIDDLPMAPTVALIAAAGPVVDGRITLTNAQGWRLDEMLLKSSFGFRSCRLVNDMSAFAAGVSPSGAGDASADIRPRSGKTLKTLVVTLGTGLGLAVRHDDGGTPLIIPSEAGNMSFNAETSEERQVLDRLKADMGHIGVETVLSGSALLRTHRALHTISGSALPTSNGALIDRATRDPNGPERRTLTFMGGALGGFVRNSLLFVAGADEVVLGGGFGNELAHILLDSPYAERLAAPSGTSLDFSRIRTRTQTEADTALVGAGLLAAGKARVLGTIL